ncbi:MAG: hypothetical protein K0S37_3763 [Microbacterium sp.]|jgi:hypothetical protein|nr:hypothetical protein [Microbacterium sp.]
MTVDYLGYFLAGAQLSIAAMWGSFVENPLPWLGIGAAFVGAAVLNATPKRRRRRP